MIKRKRAMILQLTTFLQMFSSQVIQPLVSRGVHDATIVVIHRSQWPTAEHSAVLSGVLQSLTRASLAPKHWSCCTSDDVPEVRNHHLGLLLLLLLPPSCYYEQQQEGGLEG
jgi:hypothetical protein